MSNTIVIFSIPLPSFKSYKTTIVCVIFRQHQISDFLCETITSFSSGGAFVGGTIRLISNKRRVIIGVPDSHTRAV